MKDAPIPRLPIIIRREQALRMGFTHEGTHFGVPIWASFRRDTADMAVKFAPLELWVSLCLVVFQFLNSLRPPGEESDFPFLVRPIPGGPMHHDYTTEGDWIDAATTYILDHSDVGSRDAAAEYARDMAEEQAAQHGPEVEVWMAPGAAAYVMMSEDWSGEPEGP